MSFIKNAFAYSGTNILSQAAMFVQAFLLRILLIPDIMGVWNFIQVVRGYVAPVSLGAVNGAFRELPILKGKGEKDEEMLCRSVCLTASIAETVVLALGILGYMVWHQKNYSVPEIWAFLTAAALVILMRIHECYMTFFQGAQLYLPLSRILLINGLIFAALLPAGAAMGGLAGLMAAAVAAQIIRAIWLFSGSREHGIGASIKWDTSVWKRLVSFGIGYRVTDYPLVLFMMMDLLWVTKFMDAAALAIYATARSLAQQAFDVTTRFGTVFYTRVLEEYGKVTSKKKMGGDFRSFILTLLLVAFPLVCWAVVSTFPFLVRQIIPRYSDSLFLILPLMISGFFIPQNHHLFSVWIAERRLAAYGLSNIFGLVFITLILIIFWYAFDLRELKHIAVAIALGYAAHFVYMMAAVGRTLFGGIQSLIIFIQVSLGAAWTGFVMYVFGQLTVQKMSFLEDVVFSLKTGILSLAALLPLLAYGLWAGKGWSLLYRKWNSVRIRP